jgi:hypothetical protein
MFKRRRFQQTESLTDRLATFGRLLREQAESMPPGDEKSARLAKAREVDVAIDMNRWIRSSELKGPE